MAPANVKIRNASNDGILEIIQSSNGMSYNAGPFFFLVNVVVKTGDVMKRAASRGRILTFEKGPQIILTRKPVAPGKNEDGKSQMSVMTTLGYFTDVEDPASIPGTASNPPRDVSLLVSTSTAPEPPLRTHTTSDEPTMILSRPEIPEIKDITPTAGQAQPPTQPPSYPRENGGRWVDAKDLCVGDRVELDELDALDPKGRWTLQTAVRYGVTLR
ncbi:hypothetical protein H2200_007536 [Cladophialophora chaetospira]|uniref:Uncharacterized protein n=1 Tax=Cladophialophora chaetospira TaxID=386627 RepID=A0AA39CHR8_9EURO|nr:hypothetical protein H2200_007536 [Cladophialophora chaetospira]